MTITPPPPPVWDAPSPIPATVGYGGFWIRVVAYIIDAIVLSIAGSIVGAILGVGMALGQANPEDIRPGSYIVGIVISWLYFALMESSAHGASLGKMALGLRVVTVEGERLSFANATGRYAAKFISAMLLCIGFIMVAFTDRKRGLHDMMAHTLVVKTR